MHITRTKLEGVYIIEPKIFTDNRGLFVKTFHQSMFSELGISLKINESYYSTSKQGVIRGMHFQSPPHHHTKLVYVTNGSITDVVLDMRVGSPTYGKQISVDINQTNRKIVYIPAGFAHGFVAREDDSCVVYCQSSGYSQEHDGGVRFDSFGFDWGVDNPIVSDRDQSFPTLADFHSPFSDTKASK